MAEYELKPVDVKEMLENAFVYKAVQLFDRGATMDELEEMILYALFKYEQYKENGEKIF